MGKQPKMPLFHVLDLRVIVFVVHCGIFVLHSGKYP